MSSLAEHLRSIGIDYFKIEGSVVRIGSWYWIAEPCQCASSNCDGWNLRLRLGNERQQRSNLFDEGVQQTSVGRRTSVKP